MNRRPVRPRQTNPFDPLDGPIAIRLDLHGFSAAEAERHLPAWLRQCADREPGTLVHVITGKGRNSPGGAVLRPRVKRLLSGLRAPGPVAAFGLDDDEAGYLVRLRG